MKASYSLGLFLRQKIFISILLFFIVSPPLEAKKFRRHIRKHHKKHSLFTNNKNLRFSTTTSHFISPQKIENYHEYTWTQKAPFNFSELILSWNAQRPDTGKFTFLVNVYHKQWSGWQRLAEWGATTQKTFNNKKNPYVHTKHVRVVMRQKQRGRAFKIKVLAENGASIYNLKALFACLSTPEKFAIVKPSYSLPSTIIKGVPKLSQMRLDHPRYHDLCSPTSTSLIVNYFINQKCGIQRSSLNDYVCDFADKVHDNGKFDAYGSWILNVAQAYDASNGKVFYHVERLNSFCDLYKYLSKKIPVAVSVRHLKGGASPYNNGHFMVVVGWNRDRQSVICIDPAFRSNAKTLKAYKIGNFLRAWGRSVNLSYVPTPKKYFKEIS